MTENNNVLMKALASELGVLMINAQISDIENTQHLATIQKDGLIINGMRERILSLESDVKALREEVIAFRKKPNVKNPTNG